MWVQNPVGCRASGGEQIGNRIVGCCGAAVGVVSGTNGTLLRAISLMYGRFGGPCFAKWLIYGTETRISRVRALQFRAPYLRYHDLGAIYKPLGILQLSESAIRKPSSVVCGRISPFPDRRGPILSDFGDGELGGGDCGGVGRLSRNRTGRG